MNWTELNKLVIHLPERVDRFEAFNKELIYLPCNNLQYVNGIKHHHPYKGIAQAHLNCVMIAKQNEWPAVLIMEDDVVFQGKERSYDHLLNCLANVPEDWDILLGGIYFGKPTPVNDHWAKVGEFCALHFYIVNEKAYDKILEWPGDHHIDRWINEKGKLNCYVMRKFIATQRNGHSDNTGSNVNYTDRLKKYKLL